MTQRQIIQPSQPGQTGRQNRGRFQPSNAALPEGRTVKGCSQIGAASGPTGPTRAGDPGQGPSGRCRGRWLGARDVSERKMARLLCFALISRPVVADEPMAYHP